MNKIYNLQKDKEKVYIKKIENVVKQLEDADAIVIGIGSGMTASGGINYGDSKLVKKWFPEYAKLGFEGIMEIQSVFWNISEENVLSYWGYWAKHINYIRYESEVLEPYRVLKNIIGDKNYFICTTNADGQTQKAGFDKKRIFAPQGNYDSFQCSIPCNDDEIFYNEEMIKEMLKSINNENKIAENTIPRCPHCGNFLIPNLRCDEKFVEIPHMKNIKNYEDFIRKNANKNIVFLEMGVGYNTPGIIRYPFEKITYKFEKVKLIRINKGMAEVPKEISDKSISIDGDINTVLKEIGRGLNNE